MEYINKYMPYKTIVRLVVMGLDESYYIIIAYFVMMKNPQNKYGHIISRPHAAHLSFRRKFFS